MEKTGEEVINKVLQEAYEEVQKEKKFTKEVTIKNEKELKIEKIENTPFTLTEHNGKKLIICGKTAYKLENDEEIEEFKKPTWKSISFLTESIINFTKIENHE